jgi:copper chaperone CopZ
MKKFILILALTLFASPAFAGETVKISVNGLVCDFCARAIEKVFGKEDAIEAVSVDLSAKLITATLKDGKTISDDAFKKLVTDAGYNVVSVTRGGTDE